jgi:hypothetical protein
MTKCCTCNARLLKSVVDLLNKCKYCEKYFCLNDLSTHEQCKDLHINENKKHISDKLIIGTLRKKVPSI